MKKNKRHTEEARRKMSEAHKGVKLSEAHRRKLKGQIPWNKGKRTPEGVRRKLSEAKTSAGVWRKESNPNWKGGLYVNHSGYIYLLSREHPHANRLGYVRRSRLVMEAHIGRVLLPTEVVHHVNGQKADDRIENLALFPALGDHARDHSRDRARDRRGRYA